MELKKRKVWFESGCKYTLRKKKKRNGRQALMVDGEVEGNLQNGNRIRRREQTKVQNKSIWGAS